MLMEISTMSRLTSRPAPTTALTLMPLAWWGLGPVYAAAAVVLGAGFVWLAVRLWRDVTPARARVLFHYSLAYLALLFVALAIDPLIS